LQSKFAIIRLCTLTLAACAIGRLVSGFMLQPAGHAEDRMGHSGSHQLGSAFSLLINALVGVFLQNDDPTFRGLYNFMVSTCCQPCHEQGMCQGGLTCLMPWTVLNAVSFAMGLLPLGQDSLIRIPDYLQKAMEGDHGPGNGLLGLSLLGSLIAIFVGAFVGWRCMQQARDGGVTMQGGDWGQEMQQGRPGTWGGGSLGGGASTTQALNYGRSGNLNYAGGRDHEEDTQPARTQAAGGNFQVFQGSGHRLGGG